VTVVVALVAAVCASVVALHQELRPPLWIWTPVGFAFCGLLQAAARRRLWNSDTDAPTPLGWVVIAVTVIGVATPVTIDTDDDAFRKAGREAAYADGRAWADERGADDATCEQAWANDIYTARGHELWNQPWLDGCLSRPEPTTTPPR
jgi:hypothetical protein